MLGRSCGVLGAIWQPVDSHIPALKRGATCGACEAVVMIPIARAIVCQGDIAPINHVVTPLAPVPMDLEIARVVKRLALLFYKGVSAESLVAHSTHEAAFVPTLTESLTKHIAQSTAATRARLWHLMRGLRGLLPTDGCWLRAARKATGVPRAT